MNEETLAQFLAYWRVAERMIEKASREELADVARILALHAAAYARRHGDLPPEEHLLVLKAGDFTPEEVLQSEQGEQLLALLRDGAAALAGVLGSISDREAARRRRKRH